MRWILGVSHKGKRKLKVIILGLYDVEEKSEVDKISDVAKTFKNLRNQLIYQNRSRVKVNLNIIKSQKNNENQLRLQTMNPQSRNKGEQKLNSEE